jgi:hypothetical protein
MSIFKIQRADGLFSKGGCYVHWSKNGKSWNHIGHVRSSIGSNTEYRLEDYNNSDLVTYELVEVSRIPMSEFIAETQERRAERDREAEIKYEQYRRKHKLEEYERLKKELEIE